MTASTPLVTPLCPAHTPTETPSERIDRLRRSWYWRPSSAQIHLVANIPKGYLTRLNGAAYNALAGDLTAMAGQFGIAPELLHVVGGIAVRSMPNPTDVHGSPYPASDVGSWDTIHWMSRAASAGFVSTLRLTPTEATQWAIAATVRQRRYPYMEVAEVVEVWLGDPALTTGAAPDAAEEVGYWVTDAMDLSTDEGYVAAAAAFRAAAQAGSMTWPGLAAAGLSDAWLAVAAGLSRREYLMMDPRPNEQQLRVLAGLLAS